MPRKKGAKTAADHTLELLDAQTRAKDMWAIRCFCLKALLEPLGLADQAEAIIKCQSKQQLYEFLQNPNPDKISLENPKEKP
jgi:hypothetical protein